jgi:hypothetical protein
MATYHPPDGYSKVLDEAHKKYLGDLDTGIKCNCGQANITDQATAEDPNAAPIDFHNVICGPSPTHFQRLQSFHVFHRYFCKFCGDKYENDIIEGSRGYKPLEAREPIVRTAKGLDLAAIVFERAHR